MLHRAGNVDGEGDGCGLLLDIPRGIWADEVRAGGHASHLALDPCFAVGHLMIDRSETDPGGVRERARELMRKAGAARARRARGRGGLHGAGPRGPRGGAAVLAGGRLGGGAAPVLRACRGAGGSARPARGVVSAPTPASTRCWEPLPCSGGYYPDLRDPRAETAAVFGHNRYSTNTWTSFRRAQPFGVLGHNGEINTIARLRQEARMLERAAARRRVGLAGPRPARARRWCTAAA